MSAGITKVHGTVAAPSQRPSTLSFFTIDFGVNLASSVGVVGGAFEKAINACSNFATIAMIGTLNNDGGTGQTIRIAIEDTGVDAYSDSGLGMGLPDEYSDTATALEEAIQALGASAGVDSKNLTGTSVTAFVL
jgi:hypothetical protein